MGASTVGAREAVQPGRARTSIGTATLVLTWALMVVGALTRASQAGVSCPDWPLCHGYLVPPLDPQAYPANPLYQVQKVYLEFGHRALAGLVGLGAALVAWRAWRARHRALSVAVLGTLALQVGMGAATVWLENAPYTVVAHLALALAFLGALAAAHRRAPSEVGGPREGGPAGGIALVLALLVAQMLVGAAVSSGSFALACPDFPLCEPGALWPSVWTEGAAWQMAHRVLGAALLLASLVQAARSLRAGHDRVLWLGVTAGVLAQALLGGVAVWLRLPPWVSAAHLGLATLLFAALSLRLARRDTARGVPAHTPLLHRAA